MKLVINKKILERAMSHSMGIIDKKQSIPVLGYVLFDASVENGLKITSTNMDMTIIDNISCEIEKSGSYCLPAGLLYDITRKIKSGSDITMEYSEEKNSIQISSGRVSFSIHYMENDNFPPISESSYDVCFEMPSKTLKECIDVAKVAMLQDNTRFHLNGIHMHYENDLGTNKIRFVATDLFRISCVSALSPFESQSMPAVIISKKTVSEILKLIDAGSSENVTVSVSSSRVSFKLADEDFKTEFSSRLINGTFPEYSGALNVSNDKILVVNTEDIISAIDRVSTVVVDSTNSVRLEITGEKLTLSGVSRELGTAVEEIEVSFNSLEPFEICFNGKYLLEILNCIETPQVKFLLAESNSSTIVQPMENSDKEMVFAVMPIEIVKS